MGKYKSEQGSSGNKMPDPRLMKSQEDAREYVKALVQQGLDGLDPQGSGLLRNLTKAIVQQGLAPQGSGLFPNLTNSKLEMVSKATQGLIKENLGKSNTEYSAKELEALIKINDFVLDTQRFRQRRLDKVGFRDDKQSFRDFALDKQILRPSQQSVRQSPQSERTKSGDRTNDGNKNAETRRKENPSIEEAKKNVQEQMNEKEAYAFVEKLVKNYKNGDIYKAIGPIAGLTDKELAEVGSATEKLSKQELEEMRRRSDTTSIRDTALATIAAAIIDEKKHRKILQREDAFIKDPTTGQNTGQKKPIIGISTALYKEGNEDTRSEISTSTPKAATGTGTNTENLLASGTARRNNAPDSDGNHIKEPNQPKAKQSQPAPKYVHKGKYHYKDDKDDIQKKGSGQNQPPENQSKPEIAFVYGKKTFLKDDIKKQDSGQNQPQENISKDTTEAGKGDETHFRDFVTRRRASEEKKGPKR